MLVSQRLANNSNSPFSKQPTDTCSFLLFHHLSSPWKASHALLPGLSTQMCMDKTSVGQNHLTDSSFLWFSPLLYIYLYQEEVVVSQWPVYSASTVSVSQDTPPRCPLGRNNNNHTHRCFKSGMNSNFSLLLGVMWSRLILRSFLGRAAPSDGHSV